MAASEFISGPYMVMTWIYSGGTVVLNADYQTCTFTPTVAYVDTSAGADTHITRLTALKDSTAAITLLMQSGTSGTAIQASLATGTGGTLVIQPKGTAASERKITMPAYSDGAVVDFPYGEKAVISCGFTGNGAFTDTVN
jgi:hypothetical protein